MSALQAAFFFSFSCWLIIENPATASWIKVWMFGFLVALLDDGMAHSVTGFVLLSCNRINNIHSLRTRGSDHWAACTRSFLYSLFSALASWMTPCFRVFSSPSWGQEAVSHPARSASCRWWDGRGLDWIGWGLLCYCRRLCWAKAAVSAGCWGLASFIRTGWDNAAIRPQPGGASQA